MDKCYKSGDLGSFFSNLSPEKNSSSAVYFSAVKQTVSKPKSFPLKRKHVPEKQNDKRLHHPGQEISNKFENSQVVYKTGSLKPSNAQKGRDDAVDERTIFIGNLPLNTTKKVLLTKFKQFGLIESVRFRNAVSDDDKISKKLSIIRKRFSSDLASINAFLVYAEASSASAALSLNSNFIIGDHCIRVDLAKNSKIHDHKKSVYLANLSKKIKEVDIRTFFDDCGTVQNVRLVRENATGLPRGFGYVLFSHRDAVTLALKLNGTALLGKAVKVARSVNKDKAGGSAVSGNFKANKMTNLGSKKSTAIDKTKSKKKQLKEKRLKKNRASIANKILGK